MATERAERWLPLLRALTAATPDWTVWKNASSALRGTGDVDSAAPRRAWPVVEACVDAWVDEQRLDFAFVCRHIPRTVNFLALLPGTPFLLQLEVKAGATFRGSIQFVAEDLLALSEIDDLGFRRVRPGAEGVLKLLNNGMGRGGVPRPEGLRAKDVVALLRADPDGAAAMARRFRPADAALRRGIAAVVAGGWDRRAMMTVEAWAVAKAVAQPHVVAERAWFRAVRKPTCPALQAVYRADRRVPGDLAAWQRRVATTHRLVGGGGVTTRRAPRGGAGVPRCPGREVDGRHR